MFAFSQDYNASVRGSFEHVIKTSEEKTHASGICHASRPMMNIVCERACLARMAVKAAWPGVSRKVMRLSESGMETWKAPMLWVMPPASPAATDVFRRASRSVVLPWSTCPMIVTTGGRGTASLLRSCRRNHAVFEFNPSPHTLACPSSIPQSVCPSRHLKGKRLNTKFTGPLRPP